MLFIENRKVYESGTMRNSLYFVQFRPQNQNNDVNLYIAKVRTCLSTDNIELELLHRKFGHLNCQNLVEIIKRNVINKLKVNNLKIKYQGKCSICVEVKHKKIL